jgi:hypothetical protein
MLKLRELLLKRKTEIVKQIAQLEMGLTDQDGPAIELGDAAQKEDLKRLLDHLVERENEALDEYRSLRNEGISEGLVQLSAD